MPIFCSTMEQPSIPGIILAAGRSQRMGKNKLLLTYHGKPILQHVIDVAKESTLFPLILVLGFESDRIQSQVDLATLQVTQNNAFSSGYGSSLQAGLKALSTPCSGAMFLLGDQPLVTVDTLEQLILAFQKEPERWIAPSFNGQRGNPVIAPASQFDTIFALTGDTGPRKHLKSPSANLKIVEVENRGVVLDIDNPEDYDRLNKV